VINAPLLRYIIGKNSEEINFKLRNHNKTLNSTLTYELVNTFPSVRVYEKKGGKVYRSYQTYFAKMKFVAGRTAWNKAISAQLAAIFLRAGERIY